MICALFFWCSICVCVSWLIVLWGACVENVLDSVVVSLQLNQNRKFVFAEMV